MASLLTLLSNYSTWLDAHPYVLWLIVLGAVAFWIWMLVDCIRNEPNVNEKVMWALTIILFNWIGALIYFFFGKLHRHRRQPPLLPR